MYQINLGKVHILILHHDFLYYFLYKNTYYLSFVV